MSAHFHTEVEHDSEPDTKDVQRQFPSQSSPQPPSDLWDTTDTSLLEAVRCSAFVRVAAVDPKLGTFRVRMKCIWSFRTLNSHEDTELRLRGVPGIRMPGLVEYVEESRVWKDISTAKTTRRTIFWKGISLFTIDGFKAFHMQPFPFDRHVLNLERLEFVWRPDKDAADYYKSMKVVSFTVECSSMLPEWNVHYAYVKELDAVDGDAIRQRVPYYYAVGGLREERALKSASKFNVRLRIERLHTYYGWQVFLVTYLITILAVMPLGMHPKWLADRLTVYAGGTLTLVAFKYSVSDHLPSVPYLTLTDKFLLAQILTLCLCGFLGVMSQRACARNEDLTVWIDHSEHVLAVGLVIGWTVALLRMTNEPRWRTKWKTVIEREDNDQDDFCKRASELERTVTNESGMRQAARRGGTLLRTSKTLQW